jgi:SAM-dependent methyltransferase
VGFDNAAFWDERYRTKIELGSGAGSRGEFLAYKRARLQDVIARFPFRSILDVGCGDIEATRTLQFDGAFTGIDVSPYVIERNREIRPDWWKFFLGEFTELARSGDLHADLVLCLDVLIHQHDREHYREFVRALLKASRVATVLNGFESLPRSGKLSPNVAFHEPIGRTLQEVGATKLEHLATFRRTSIVLIDTRCTP